MVRFEWVFEDGPSVERLNEALRNLLEVINKRLTVFAHEAMV